jgi:hypothetical protein
MRKQKKNPADKPAEALAAAAEALAPLMPTEFAGLVGAWYTALFASLLLRATIVVVMFRTGNYQNGVERGPEGGSENFSLSLSVLIVIRSRRL